jgi:hypothetical protein
MNYRLILILLLLTSLLQAQDNYMSLSFGLSNPMGDYANTEILENDGYAINGFLAEYSGAYYLKNHFGITGAIKFNQNTLDYTAAKEALRELIPSDGIEKEGSLNIGYWSIVSFGVGPQISIPIIGNLYFDVFVLPGLHIVTSPKMELSAIVDETSIKYTISSQNLSVGFETGVSLRTLLGKKTGLRIFASYLQSSSKGEVLQKIENENDINSITDFSKTIQLLDAGIGIVYKMDFQ